MHWDVPSIIGLTVATITAIVACCVRLKRSILEHTFGSGLVAGDSFQRLSPRAIRKRHLEQRAKKRRGLLVQGQGMLIRALSSSEMGRRAVESADAGLSLAKDRLGGELFRSRGDLSLQMTPLSEAVPEPLTDAVRHELRAVDLGDLNFSGKWVVDRGRSSSLDLHLEALGLPWVARAVAANSNYSATIDHQGLWWRETSTTAVVTTTQEFRLDNRKQSEPHPMDKSECICQTRVEADAPRTPLASPNNPPCSNPAHPGLSAASGEPVVPPAPLPVPPRGVQQCRVVTRTSYLKHGHTQVVSRWLEDGGETYVVSNDLTLVKKGVVLRATLYFNRVHDSSSDEEKGD